MLESSWKPTAGGDDGGIHGSIFNNSENHIWIGYYSSSAIYSNFIRFPNVTIKKGNTTILSAKLRYYACSSETGSITTNLYFNNEDNAIAPTTYDLYVAKTLTSGVGFNIVDNWVNGQYYDTPDISTILQDIVDRPGWVSGNAVMLLHKWVSGNFYRQMGAYECGNSSQYPELIVTWEEYSGYFSGYTFEQNNPVSRKLYLYERDTGNLIDTTTSSGSGYYYLETSFSGSHNIVCLDDVAGIEYNDLISGAIFPTTISG